MDPVKLSKQAIDAGYYLTDEPAMAVGTYGKFGTVDFPNLTAKKAKRLVAKGFKLIAFKEVPKPAAKQNAGGGK